MAIDPTLLLRRTEADEHDRRRDRSELLDERELPVGVRGQAVIPDRRPGTDDLDAEPLQARSPAGGRPFRHVVRATEQHDDRVTFDREGQEHRGDLDPRPSAHATPGS